MPLVPLLAAKKSKLLKDVSHAGDEPSVPSRMSAASVGAVEPLYLHSSVPFAAVVAAKYKEPLRTAKLEGEDEAALALISAILPTLVPSYRHNSVPKAVSDAAK